MAGQASFSSSFTYGWTYDVFLSFRGLDTRHGFTGYLYNALIRKGIHTFIDDEELQRGEEIKPSLAKAIQESRIAVVVLSKNYASSAFCLDELSKILECIKEKGRLVLPIFYDVDPCDVRHLRGTYGEALAQHEKRFEANEEKVQNWRRALHQAANLSGWHLKHGVGYEYEFIGKIVEEVSRKINRVPLPVADYPVGLESEVLNVNSLLDVGSNDGVIMVGIHGIGGIGKTTLALAVYNLIADHFDGLCFLENVRENSNKHGLVPLQQILLSEILGEKKIKLASVKQGISIIQHRLRQKKVLLILDDVDKLEQLEAMVGGSYWFGSGSRVIITTRDKHLLACHGVKRTYELVELNKTDALELLSWKAFKTDKVDPSYVDILNRVVAYASGLPLALEVIGSYLFGKSIEEWKSALEQYKRIPNKDIQKILKVSFDALEEGEQKIFLDIACCFKGYELAEVEGILCAHHGVCPKYGIGVLVDKSLIKIKCDLVTLHDLIEDMGKEIVRQESPNEPGERSRLWFPEDIAQVLKENKGTSKIQIIMLRFPLFKEKEVEWDGECFKEMKNLKTLIIRNGGFSKGPKHLPNSLRVLEWWGYPSQSLPSDFDLKKLVIFKLPNICFKSLEWLSQSLKKLVNLRVLDFSYSQCLREIPDVSGVPNLEELSFTGCYNLIKIHESVGFLDKLRILVADSCSNLRSFPPIRLTSLEELKLSHCYNLESFPEILGKMENITELRLMWSRIKKLPLSILNLTRLRSIYLEGCGIVQVPSTIVMLPELCQMKVWLCEGLSSSKHGEEKESSMVCSNMECLDLSLSGISDESLPIILAWFANLTYLNLAQNNFTIVPSCLKTCCFVRSFILDNCTNLQEINGIPPNLETFSAKSCIYLSHLDLTVLPAYTQECRIMRSFILDGCVKLQYIRGIPPKMEHFSASGCKSLPSSFTSMLLNQELHHEGGNKKFCLPGKWILNWLDHCSRGGFISFWFRNKFPTISLCVFTGWIFNKSYELLRPKLIINGNKEFLLDKEDGFSYSKLPEGHVLVFGEKQMKFEDNVDEVLLENEWNHVLFSIADDFYKVKQRDQHATQIGLHVFKQKSSMEDIQFTDPYERRQIGIHRTKFMRQQQNLESLDLLASTQKRWTPVVQGGCKIVSKKRKIGGSRLDNKASDQAPSKVALYSDSIMSSLAGDIASDGGLQEQHHLTSIIQQSIKGCESVNEAKGKEW